MPFKKYTDKVRFVQTATVTVADTTASTTLVGAASASNTISMTNLLLEELN